jgi:hypothetical protein
MNPNFTTIKFINRILSVIATGNLIQFAASSGAHILGTITKKGLLFKERMVYRDSKCILSYNANAVFAPTFKNLVRLSPHFQKKIDSPINLIMLLRIVT